MKDLTGLLEHRTQSVGNGLWQLGGEGIHCSGAINSGQVAEWIPAASKLEPTFYSTM